MYGGANLVSGGFPLTTPAKAREAAPANRRLARKGGDPLAGKSAAAAPTFEEADRADRTKGGPTR